MIILITYATWILVILYILQLALAIWNAWAKDREDSSIFERLLGSRDSITQTWISIGIIFVIPVLISWSSGIADQILAIGPSEALLTGCLSMLFVLITLELSTINSLNDLNREPWRGLLLFALSLDLFSVLVLVVLVKPFIASGQAGGWDSVIFFVQALGIAALLSSFCVILFSKNAGESP